MNSFAEGLNAFLLVYAALFPIVNPVGGAPIFLRMTDHVPAAERPALAGTVAVNSFMLLLGSLFIGSHVLVFFGLTLPVVRVAGGLVVASVGWKLLHEGDGNVDRNNADKHGSTADAFYPLTMPLTVGPGSISVALTLGSQRPTPTADITQITVAGIGAITGLMAIAATIFVCYRFAGSLISVLGERGTNVLLRLSAFILFCIGIQIIWGGLTALIPGI